ncbi:MAG TPA: hypothetical protein VIA62_00620 [Thermoanaerobaculia bacterium]|jgi:hypothetical protein|nr:hypothetical protein [Thermoanaerobaculia bacterium]
MKHAIVGGILLCLLGTAVPAGAVLCTIDAVPAATLLLPYFEVDLNNPNGLTTLFSINNASATAALAHVTVWSDLSVPVLDFNVYLTGYDVQTINLRDLLAGSIPVTASDGQDPVDKISPQGPKSQDVNFASCTGQLPPPPLPPSFVQHLALALTGKGSPLFGGLCAGRNLGDNIARGYITVDTVNNCTLRLPSDINYFTQDISFQNVLWGDFFYVNSANNFATGYDLVHVEASLTDPATTTAGRYTFYGRYVGWNAMDHREPLGGLFDGTFWFNLTIQTPFGSTTIFTNTIAWRDSKTNQQPFTCPATTGRPSWYPLGQEGIDIFDETEQVNTPQTFPFSPQPPQQGIIPFPAEAQSTRIGGPDFPVPFDFGWLYLNLHTTVSGNPNPPFDPAAAQAWVMTQNAALTGHFSVGSNAIQLDSACAPNHFVP